MENKNNSSQDSKKGPLNDYIKYSGLAFQMIGSLLLAAWAGSKLDAHFEVKNHWFTIFLMLFAVVASLYLVIQSLTNKNEQEKK